MMVPQQQRRRRRRVALPRTAERRVVVARGAGGFGFTIAGQRPCVVSAVAGGGPAERAGLRAGDALLAVDGASVVRASHAAVARLVAAAPGAIALSVAPREPPPTDTEDTEPDERARTRRRHPPPRRRPQAMQHHPGYHAAPSTSGVNELLQNLSRTQLTPTHASRLECRTVVGYLGTIETPQAAVPDAPSNVRSAVRRLRQERRPATPVLLSVMPNVLLLRRPSAQVLAQYHRERILYAGTGLDGDRRYFGLVTAAEGLGSSNEASQSTHVFAVDPRMAHHETHAPRAQEFQIACTRDPVAERCLEFPPSAEYVVGVIRGMYSLPAEDSASPTLQISKLALKGDSPAAGNFSRNRAVFRRPCRHDGARIEGQEFVANSPQPSNHSEITTTSSNSDSGIGFNNDCRNITDRIVVVDFAAPPPLNRFRQEMPRRPIGLVGCSSFDAESSFLSNTTPVVDGFGGQGRSLNLDEFILSANDLQPHVSPREDDNYNYNLYGNLPSTSRSQNGVYDQVYTENEGHYYEMLPDMDRVAEAFNSVEIYEERSRRALDCQSNGSVENVTVISGGGSKASMDSVSVYSTRSHEEARPSRRKHLQASLDDMLVLGFRDPPPKQKDEGTFLHPASVKYKVRKSTKPMNLLSRTKHMLTGKSNLEKKERQRAMSASVGDVAGAGGAEGGQDPLPAAASEPDLRDTQVQQWAMSACAGDVARAGSAEGGGQEPLPAAASEPDLRDTQSDQSSPFRRWTTGNGGSTSYRHTEHRGFSKQQMNEGSDPEPGVSSVGNPRSQWPSGGVAKWSLGLDHLLADPVGFSAFSAFLAKEFASENIAFWGLCDKFSKLRDANQRKVLATEIWERHLSDKAPEPVNVDAAARRAAISRLGEQPLPSDLFQQAQTQVYDMMRLDSYQRFLRSDEHAQCARANLLGNAPPFGLNIGTDSTSHTSGRAGTSAQEPATPTRVKKSSSNASDRRRSGGTSLLPWITRVPARERPTAPAGGCGAGEMVPGSLASGASGGGIMATNSSGGSGAGNGQLGLGHANAAALDHQGPASAAADLTNHLLADVKKSGTLCRVVLPDGATSVVGVEASVSVRHLVERLLHRRNMHQLNYDVIIKESPQEDGRAVDTGAPSTILGGREVHVEPRCVVRFELCGRLVAVRCRPTRRLRHVLKPLLDRYSTTPSSSWEVLQNGVQVHPETPMQKLDGLRITVNEPLLPLQASAAARMETIANNTGRASSNTVEHLAHDVWNRGRCEPIGVADRAAVANMAAASMAVACDNGGGSRAHEFEACDPGPPTNANLVRAALRPGPPLHTHPPDFLENLRETQKLRLQKGESSASSTPRTPPPLPPKPPTRAPTLV